MRRATLALLSAALVAAPSASAASKPKDAYNTTGLRNAITASGLMQHQQAFQGIADLNVFDGVPTRESGTPGYDASADYVVAKLEAAGYDPVVQEFEFPFFKLQGTPVFERVSPNPTAYSTPEQFSVMTYSGSGEASAPSTHITDRGGDPGAGCEAADFAGFTAGNVALIQRGSCPFKQKATNAIAAGAAAVVVYNNTDGPLNGTLGSPGQGNVPVIGIPQALGQELAAGSPTLRVKAETLSDVRKTVNVLADTGGDTSRTVVVGAHLDSVLAGPGINDNGSGSSAILEIAEQFKQRDLETRNNVRFAWWGAEEFNLLGSTHYVSSLSDEELSKIVANLNFDMLASPNYARFVYDGDNSAFPPAGTTVLEGPNGSGLIEDVFTQYFANRGQASSPTPFNGRSDYGPFIAEGIPAGGLFSGAEGLKTAEEQQQYGGSAGVAYDRCYHQLCDDIDNLNLRGFEELSDAAAHATFTFGQTPYPIVNGGRVREGAHGKPAGSEQGAGADSSGLHADHHQDEQ